MATLTEQLKWLVTADGQSAISTFQKVGQAAESNLGKADNRIANMGTGFTKFGAGALATAGLAGTALIKTAGSFEKLGLAADKFADSAGTTLEQSSRLIEVTGDIGVSSDALASSLNKMNKTLGATPQKFTELGVSIARAKDGTVDVQQTFLNVVDRLNAIPDAGQKAATATALLGKGWTDLSQLIEQGSSTIKTNLAAVSDQKVITPEKAQEAKNYQAALDSLSDSVESLGLALGEGVAPVIGKIASVIGGAIQAFDDLNTVTGGFLGRAATIGTIAVGAAGGLSLIVGQALKIKSNLHQAIEGVGDFAEKLGVVKHAQIADIAAVEADTAAVKANTAARAQNAGAGAADGGLGLGKVGTVVAITASVGALAAEAHHTQVVATQAANAINDLNNVPLDKLTGAFQDFLIAEAGIGKVGTSALNDLAEKNLTGAKRLLDGLKSGDVQFEGSAKQRQSYIADLTAAIEKQEDAVKGLTPEAKGLADAQLQANENAAEGAGLLNGLAAATDDSQIAAAKAARAHDDLQTAMGLEATAAKSAADAVNKQVDAIDADIKAHQDFIDAQHAAADSAFAVDKAQADFNKTLTDLPNALKGTKKGSVEQKVAYDEVAQAAGKVADAHVQLAADQASAAKQFFGATNAIDAQNSSLIEAAKQAKGPARQAIIDYVAELNNIEPQKATEILAHVDDKSLEDDKQKIANLSQTRIPALAIDIDLQSLNAAKAKIKAGLSNIRPDVRIGASAKGTKNAEPGLTLLGEQGPGITPELVVDRQGNAFMAGVNGPILASLQGGETVYTAAETKGLLRGGMGQKIQAFAGGTGRVQNVTHITTAAAVATPTGPAVDPKAAEDRRQAALYKTGQISLDLYRQYVAQRKAEEKATDSASDAYVAQYDLLKQLDDQQQKAADDAATAQDNLMKNMYELDQLSRQEYVDYLKSRLGAFAEFSDGYKRLTDEINGLGKKSVDEEKADLDERLKNQQAYYKQAQADKNAADAQAAKEQAEQDVFTAGAEGDKIQHDRKAKPEDKAKAVQDLVDKQKAYADSVYKALLADAESFNFDVGSVPWDRFMRQALQVEIDAANNDGFSITAGLLQNQLRGIPALAKGGIVKASAGGTLALIGEGGKDEAVVPLDHGALGGDTHIYNIEFRTLTKPTPREAQLIAEELAKVNRRNGRAA